MLFESRYIRFDTVKKIDFVIFLHKMLRLIKLINNKDLIIFNRLFMIYNRFKLLLQITLLSSKLYMIMKTFVR